MHKLIAELLEWLAADYMLNDFFDKVFRLGGNAYRYTPDANGEIETTTWDGCHFFRFESTTVDLRQYAVQCDGVVIWSKNVGEDA